MLIYKIFRADEFAALEAAGETLGAPIDLTDGYIHMSTAAQAPETLEKHFAGETGLIVLAIDTDRLGEDLKWEPSRGGDLFPHLYRALRRDDVVWTEKVLMYNGKHLMPPDPCQ